MSDIYLTKVERKTIFTQGLIYVLFMFVISDLTVTGPHIFCIMPWLFFLGILGVNKFYHPIMTVVISTVTTFIASLFKFDGLKLQVVTSVLVAFAMTTAGLVVGLCIKDFILEHRLVKHLSIHKKILNITVITLLTIGSLVLYAARYGNVIGYVQSRIKLDDYIKTKSGSQEYIIDQEQFVTGSFGRYIYMVKLQNETLKIQVGKEVQLINFDELKNKAELNLNDEFKQNNKLEETSVNLSYQYGDGEIKPQSIIATITIIDIDVQDEEKITKVVNEIKAVCNYNYVGKIILSINGGIQIINEHDFDKISEEYIKNSVSIESFDIN